MELLIRCGVCEQHFAPSAIAKRVPLWCCQTCAEFVDAALDCGGAVLRSRCRRWHRAAPAACGRVWSLEVTQTAARDGFVVVETDRVCGACRPAQEEHMARFLDGYGALAERGTA